MAYSTPAYGSGSWGGSSSPYDSCVQQCIASYGSPMASYTPPTATSTMASSGSGSGMTHTVIVAPTQGVLRYVPFAINASVGDTVMFVWNANEHTVTKSSELAICNETSASPFASGEQNKSFTFTQMVNDTNSTFFYCGTPGHCEKGMFGIINPPNAAMGSNTSLSSMMPAMVANSSTMSAMWSYTNMMTSNNSAAASWGSNIDMSSMPEWAMSLVAENVMYSRTFLAANPETLDATGNVNLGAAGSTPLMVPMDITAVMSNSTSNSTAAMAAGSSPSTSAGSTTPTTTNGARALASPNMLAGLITLAAIAFAL
ncbi:hypothetical protein SERLA73DRAFT_172135 [Serpula lacrymans var. lacrymans S7.3]|uniref:Phytocyanin domain-containing protein n=2 Tax=Serpula lacrymans var. lacrymans TaxID=341189 RepID=F8QEG8_SERL3|nr:uncharacterized protein SERLADRAFT_480775 [Serpula lacrymans var. lacrymans S7.9]EGN93224.1 hypothetical protein SERLA73DRAFT_172135 [Serpula lacrymans var. lacrymans S7.3]EGO18608.1 hypothetical protein SERLADRAFT_480775 [Serpula lacrymans var. lacrymans S7.9]